MVPNYISHLSRIQDRNHRISPIFSSHSDVPRNPRRLTISRYPTNPGSPGRQSQVSWNTTQTQKAVSKCSCLPPWMLGCISFYCAMLLNLTTFFSKNAFDFRLCLLENFCCGSKKIRDGNTFFTFLWKSLLENFRRVLKNS